jgi:hypothetical protein
MGLYYTSKDISCETNETLVINKKPKSTKFKFEVKYIPNQNYFSARDI